MADSPPARPPADPPDSLVGRSADERLLAAEPGSLPAAIGRPPAAAPTQSHETIVRAGATMTGVTLLAGLALLGYGVVTLVGGGSGAAAVVALAAGAVLVSTHWGWVHVAQWRSDAHDRRSGATADAARRAWLQTVAPYTRYEVVSRARPDASIELTRVRHTPVAAGPSTFRFESDVQSRELHSGELGAAEISERAELLRRQAAVDTEAERARFERAAGELETAALRARDDAEGLAARTAASEALAEQLNANARRPPLVE